MKKLFFLLFVLFSIIPVSTRAQEWNQTNGPSGNLITSITLDKNGSILVLSGTLHISSDSGLSWKQIGEQFSNIKQVTPSPWGDLYIIGYYPSGIWRSQDNGATWSLILPGDYHMTIIASSDSILCVSSQNLSNSISYRSTNGGRSWDSTIIVTDYPWTVSISAVDIHGTFFNCANNFVYRSTDKGISWSKIINGLSTGGYTDVACSQNGDDYLVARDGLYQSFDGGRTWSYLPTGQSLTSCAISNSGRILALGSDMKYSDDFGQTWKEYGRIYDVWGNPVEPYNVVAPDWRYGFFVAAKECLLHAPLQSADPWKVISVPMSGVSVIDCMKDGSILAVTNFDPGYYSKSLWRSTDLGKTWGLVFDSSLGNSEFVPTCFAIDSNNNVLLGEDGIIYKSTNYGLNWKNLTTILTPVLTSITVGQNGDIFASSSTEGIYRSSDDGQTWDQLNSGITNGRISSLAITSSGDLYTAGWGIFKSTNEGLTWTSLSGDTSKAYVNSIVIGSTGNLIAALYNDGLIQSLDNGITWAPFNDGLSTNIVNALLVAWNGVVFAGTDSGVFKLDVGSPTWRPYSLGLTRKSVLSLTQSPTGQIYAGTDGSGVFSSSEIFGTINSSVGEVKKSSDIFISAPHPNPTMNDCSVDFTLSTRNHIKIECIDALGRTVEILSDKEYDSGKYSSSLNLSKLPPGYYALRLNYDSGSQTFPIIHQ